MTPLGLNELTVYEFIIQIMQGSAQEYVMRQGPVLYTISWYTESCYKGFLLYLKCPIATATRSDKCPIGFQWRPNKANLRDLKAATGL